MAFKPPKRLTDITNTNSDLEIFYQVLVLCYRGRKINQTPKSLMHPFYVLLFNNLVSHPTQKSTSLHLGGKQQNFPCLNVQEGSVFSLPHLLPEKNASTAS